MDHSDPAIHTFLAARLKAGAPFVLFREPGERDFKSYFAGERDMLCARRPADLLTRPDAKDGFLFAPFCVEKHPILYLPAISRADTKAELLALIKADPSLTPATTDEAATNDAVPATLYNETRAKADYQKVFTRMKAELSAGTCRKIVLSRQKTLALPADFAPFAVFQRALTRYPDAMVSMFFHPKTGLWIGSTPEVLLKARAQGEHGQADTVALAGTMPLAPDAELPNIRAWSAKNREEQAYVTEYLRETIARHGRILSETGPRTVRAGALCHLKTELSLTIDANRDALCRLIDDLHPTPAVCGLPKATAFKTLLQNEGVDRRWYSGYLGPVDFNHPALPDTRLYVNLRTLSVTGKTVTVYAGGGLVEASEADAEWLETEYKMQTMIRTL